ncbi:MAG: TOBE domain-containing protein, partial [Haloferacaceae archaeon]
QVAEPEVIYHDPASIFVADFIGSPSINFFVTDYDGASVHNETFEKELPDDLNEVLSSKLDDQTVIGIRPEHMSVTEAGEGLFDVDVEVIEPLGNTKIVYFQIDGERYKLVEPATAPVEEGERVGIEFQWPHAHFFEPEGAKAAKWMNVVEGAETLEFLEDEEDQDVVRAGGDD